MKTAPDHSRAVVDALSPRLRALAPRQHVEEVDDVLIFGEDAVVVEVDRARHRSGDERAIEHAARAGADGVFAAEEIVFARAKRVFAAEEIVFDRAKRVFAAEEIVFARVKTVLAAAKCLPAGAKCLPAAEKTAPAAEESLPAAEKTAPAARAPAPAAGATAETPGATAHARALSLAPAGRRDGATGGAQRKAWKVNTNAARPGRGGGSELHRAVGAREERRCPFGAA